MEPARYNSTGEGEGLGEVWPPERMMMKKRHQQSLLKVPRGPKQKRGRPRAYFPASTSVGVVDQRSWLYQSPVAIPSYFDKRIPTDEENEAVCNYDADEEEPYEREEYQRRKKPPPRPGSYKGSGRDTYSKKAEAYVRGETLNWSKLKPCDCPVPRKTCWDGECPNTSQRKEKSKGNDNRRQDRAKDRKPKLDDEDNEWLKDGREKEERGAERDRVAERKVTVVDGPQLKPAIQQTTKLKSRADDPARETLLEKVKVRETSADEGSTSTKKGKKILLEDEVGEEMWILQRVRCQNNEQSGRPQRPPSMFEWFCCCQCLRSMFFKSDDPYYMKKYPAS